MPKRLISRKTQTSVAIFKHRKLKGVDFCLAHQAVAITVQSIDVHKRLSRYIFAVINQILRDSVPTAVFVPSPPLAHDPKFETKYVRNIKVHRPLQQILTRCVVIEIRIGILSLQEKIETRLIR